MVAWNYLYVKVQNHTRGRREPHFFEGGALPRPLPTTCGNAGGESLLEGLENSLGLV